MRRRWIWTPESKSLEEISSDRKSKRSHLIMGDLPDFVSPIDGTVVHGRAGLRAHDKHHNVTNPADFKNEWAAKAKERERFYTPGSGYDRARRVEHIKRALEKTSRRK